MSSDDEIGPCELGTKEYWDKAYQLEINNFKSHGDVGEEWFGEDSAQRIVRWLSKSDLVRPDSKIIDLGSGNGMLLVNLAEEDFTQLLGVDYSDQAVELARAVAKKMDLNISYEVWDILGTEPCPNTPYDVALDKGTYDAIALSDDGTQACATYIDKVHDILTPEGLLILTSCNFSRPELELRFSQHFNVISHIPAPTFRFGGKEGSLVTALVLQKK